MTITPYADIDKSRNPQRDSVNNQLKDPNSQDAMVSKVLSLLRSAVTQTQGSLTARADALSDALGQANRLITYLQSTKPDALSDKAKELINLYEQGSALFNQYVKEIAAKAIEDATPLAETILQIPESNRTENMVRFLTLYYEIQNRMQEELTTLSALSLLSQVHELETVEKEIRDEAKDMRAAELSRGLSGMFGGAMQAGMGCRAAAANRQLGKMDAGVKNYERQARVAADAGRSGEANTHTANAIHLHERTLDKRMVWERSTIASNAMPNVVAGFGAGGAADAQVNAADDRADQTKHQASATQDEKSHSGYEGLKEVLERANSSMLNVVGEYLKAKEEQYKAVARV